MRYGYRSRWLLLGLVLSLLPGDGIARRPNFIVGPKGTSEETLKGVNLAARAAYGAARAHVLDRCGPIVLWNGDEIIFRYGIIREACAILPSLYHDLKTVGHIALGLDALIVLRGDGKLDDLRRFELTSHRALIPRTREALRQRILTDEQRQRQEKILQACDDYLAGVLREGEIRRKDLVVVLRKIVPLLDENNMDATRAQVDAMHAQMLAIKGRLSADEWSKLHVIVLGTQPPRKDNLAVQYFARLLGVPGEGDRILYAEGIFDEKKVLDLLGTKLLDREIGKDFWNDPTRLHRDLLGDSGRIYVEKLFKGK